MAFTGDEKLKRRVQRKTGASLKDIDLICKRLGREWFLSKAGSEALNPCLSKKMVVELADDLRHEGGLREKNPYEWMVKQAMRGWVG